MIDRTAPQLTRTARHGSGLRFDVGSWHGVADARLVRKRITDQAGPDSCVCSSLKPIGGPAGRFEPRAGATRRMSHGSVRRAGREGWNQHCARETVAAPGFTFHRDEERMIDNHAAMRSVRVLVLLFALGLTACASWGRKETGAVIGAAAGGAAGAVIGNQTGSTTRGAIIGAVVGGAAGAIIGHQMDQQAKELRQNIPGATVARVGEGITVTFASGLLYNFDSEVVRVEAAKNLRALAASLGKYPNTDLLISGHTDAVGSTTYNQSLSQRRATAAADYLVAQGVASTRTRAVGRGESESIAPNDTEAGRQANRRVEIAIYASEAARKQ